MKNLNTTILTACIALCCLTNTNAQENARGKNRGKVVMTGRPGSIVVIGGGTSMPSSDGKENAFLSNTAAINADAFLQLKRWTPFVPKPHISIGLNICGTYNFGGSGGFGTTPNPFAVTGQTSSMVSDKTVDPKSPGFRMGVGPQVNFQFGKLIISPMVLGEYFSMTQNEKSSVQTTQYNGQSYEFTLSSMPKTKTSGFAVTPKLRLHYMLTDRFGFYADASYTMGPKIETTVSKLIPNGNPQTPGDTYNIQQLQYGTMVKGETTSTAYRAMGFNFGVVIGLGKSKHETSKNSVSNIRRTTKGTPIDDTQTAVRNKTKSNSTNERTAGDIRKGWNGKIVDMVVPKTGENTANIENITVKGSGDFTQNGLPIVYGRTVTGNIKAANGMSNANIAIKIEQKESNDVANAITDSEGNFTMKLAGDTVHIISINNVEYGKIKILEVPSSSGQATDDIKKGWNGIILSNAVCLLKDSYGNCDNGGVLCISSTKALDDIGTDELLTNAQITKENSKITVTSTEIVSKISAESLAKFKNKSITNAAIEFPKAELETLFETINLKLPKGANQFAANEVSYSVTEDNVIKIMQLKSIVIENSAYEFEIVTLILNRTKMSLEKLDELNGTKSTRDNANNNPSEKQWVECNGGLQWDCHYDAGGNIVSNPNGRACTGNWSTY